MAGKVGKIEPKVEITRTVLKTWNLSLDDIENMLSSYIGLDNANFRWDLSGQLPTLKIEESEVQNGDEAKEEY